MVTVHDVARVAGVSISTVSRALAAPERVAAATRARVQAAADALGYVPNRAASGLRAGRTSAVGLVVPDLENPYFASVTKGVQARARAAGLAVFVVDAEEDPHLEADLVASLAPQTDGLLLCSPRQDDAAVRDAAGRARVVLVNREVAGVPSVCTDHARGTELAIEHLRALGHARVAVVGGPERSWSQERRADGVRRAVERFDDLDVVELGAYRPHVDGGYSAADAAVATGATAVLAFNDLQALGLVRRLAGRGIRVPDDVSVVGCDDTFVAGLAATPLTTVRTDLRGMGATAVDLLADLLRPGNEPEAPRVVLPAELVVRASTADAPRVLVPSPAVAP
ncbi:LacI family transcriptional regulator [Sediminihabitans luteus]|uniref:LacI family transcriptional regulator n=1 Tax=Sediminihabitans luteus TaxID=1138585 RepID=A0A2M9CZR8_9CELL|nr:LacI family DNA-binding transcriptional regulator [Sediminihabitans luteus]PJJ77444.1 LacI family transcriptional regulator [Sediminihabitans luteus]GII98337.1 LacI family transcriptional regulator [Sediminihabitans luteus]